MYTSLELSKKLKENGCDIIQPILSNSFCYDKPCWYKVFKNWDKKIFDIELGTDGTPFYDEDYALSPKVIVPAYDILYDICIKYAKKFFGKEETVLATHDTKTFISTKYPKYKAFSIKILEMLQQKRPQKEVEEYLWENYLFNPKNKEGK